MTFSKFFKIYAYHYGRNDGEWLKVYMLNLMEKGMCSDEHISDHVQDLMFKMAHTSGIVEYQLFRTIRDRLIYVLEDWFRLQKKNENIFEIFGISQEIQESHV